MKNRRIRLAAIFAAEVQLSQAVEPDSLRLLATENGLNFFAAHDADHTNACLAVVPADSTGGWVSGYGELRPQSKIADVSSTPLGISAALVADGNDAQLMESDGWSQIHENVFIKRWDTP